MKVAKILSAAVIASCLMVTSAFAAPANPDLSNGPQQKNEDVKKDSKCKDFKGGKGIKEKDPIKALENRKAKVQSLLKEGKITKEKADKITARIDEKIKTINEFNKLTPDQKRAKLTEDFKTFMAKKVKEGKLTQEQADERIKAFNEKVKQWDGTGYPHFFKKGMKHGHHKDHDKQQ